MGITLLCQMVTVFSRQQLPKFFCELLFLPPRELLSGLHRVLLSGLHRELLPGLHRELLSGISRELLSGLQQEKQQLLSGPTL